jgi:cellulose synthase/poly-beta-1,6-N-acetylglucosamine synthase-like glycosyltransferase
MAVYGLLGLVTLFFYYRHRQPPVGQPCSLLNDPPLVTVQLPLYNERLVVERLISAAVRLDYPRHLLQIQIIDDSTDETSQIAAQWMAHYKEEGFWVEHLRRRGRKGYKAGALQAALPLVQGKYVALFDADFVPPSQFLQHSVPYLEGDPSLGMVQARWGHLNADDSPLTAAQAIALDKHFAIEQRVRHRANLFPKFNGAAGIWRRRCIEEVGGWESDTVTEDLCLSTRAILAGWRFRFQDDLVAPA